MSSKKIIIGAVAAVLVLLVAGVAIGGGSSSKDSPDTLYNYSLAKYSELDSVTEGKLQPYAECYYVLASIEVKSVKGDLALSPSAFKLVYTVSEGVTKTASYHADSTKYYWDYPGTAKISEGHSTTYCLVFMIPETYDFSNLSLSYSPVGHDAKYDTTLTLEKVYSPTKPTA